MRPARFATKVTRAASLVFGECYSGELLASSKQFFLPLHIVTCRIGLACLQMIEVLPRHLGGWILAHREPHLRAIALFEIVGRSRTSHPGGNPAGVDRVRKNLWPAACHGKRQQHIVQLAVSVCLLSLPPMLLPEQVLQARSAALVQTGTEIDQTRWFLNKRCEDVGSQRIDREYMRQAVFGRNAARLLVPDRSVMNDSIELSQRVHLFGDLPRLVDTCQIADDNGFCSGNRGHCLPSSRLVAGMQSYRVPLLD